MEKGTINERNIASVSILEKLIKLTTIKAVKTTKIFLNRKILIIKKIPFRFGNLRVKPISKAARKPKDFEKNEDIVKIFSGIVMLE